MRVAIAGQLRAGRVVLRAHASRIDMTLALDSPAGRRFYRRLSRQLDRLLAFRGVTLSLSIDRMLAEEIAHFERLLTRLSRHGDRISIVVGEQLQQIVRIDSSRFNLVLKGAALR